MKNYYELLEELSKKGLEAFKQELNSNIIYRGLLWTEIPHEDGSVEIEIETWDGENYDSEFLTSIVFNESGNSIS